MCFAIPPFLQASQLLIGIGEIGQGVKDVRSKATIGYYITPN